MRNVLLAVAASAGLASVAVGNARYTAWQAENPFTQAAWATHEGTSTSHQYDVLFLQDVGLNTGWDGRNSASSSHVHPKSLNYPTLFMSHQNDHPDLSGFIADFSIARQVHSNMIGVVLGDEVQQVFGTGGLNHQAGIRNWIVNHSDPTISSLMTISSNLGGDTVADDANTRAHWENTYNTLLPDVWLSQHYPYVGAGLDSSYYRDLQWYSDWSKSKDVAMWIYPQAYAFNAQSTPSESELRHQRFTSLGYGVKGFADFMFLSNPNITVPGTAYYDNGSPTTMANQLKPINQEIANISRSLVALTHARTYHTDGQAGVFAFSASDNDLPVNLRRTGKLTGALSDNGNKLQLGFFKDSAGSEYFMVVNKNASQSSTGAALASNVTLNFDSSVTAIRRLNRATGVIETIPVSGGQHTFNLTGGTGDLFKYAGTPFMIQKTERQPLTLFYEDFERFSVTSSDYISNLDPQWSVGGVTTTYGANGPLLVAAGVGADGSYGMREHNGGMKGVEHAIPTGPISTGQLTLEADLSFLTPLHDLGSGQFANLILATDSGPGIFPAINFEIGDNGKLYVQAGTLGVSSPTILLGNTTGTPGREFHLTLDVDLDEQTFIASVAGDLNASTGEISFTNAFAPDVFALLAGRFPAVSGTAWDNVKLTWLEPGPLVGDIDNNGSYHGHDIDLLQEAIFANTNFQYYDVNGDELVNSADLNHLLVDILDTTPGDTDLDGDVDLADLSNLAASYGGTVNVGWAKGNFDGDSDVDLNDLSTLAAYYGSGQAEAFAAFQSLTGVPEPSSAALLMLCGLAMRRRSR